ncbi:hypothetical protein ACQUQU_13860 [Thalassolituus sp. LLYu03]|uniref:hypothetical protein n=1 Tax=Thalassolituus sp. LLYu03 TaxID=3421656 RepID=UPI003D2E81C5
MSVSAISGSSMMMPMPQNQQKPERLEDKLSSLVEAIDSGDTEAVQSAYDSIVESLPEGASVGGDDPIGQFLAAVSDGLSSNDISSLQAASETFATFTPPQGMGGAPGMGGDMGPPPPPPPPPVSSETSDSISSLFSALESSDTEAAQSSYDALLAALSDNQSYTPGDGYDNPLQDALTQVGEALESGDTDLAQSYLETLMQQLPPGSLLSANV